MTYVVDVFNYGSRELGETPRFLESKDLQGQLDDSPEKSNQMLAPGSFAYMSNRWTDRLG